MKKKYHQARITSLKEKMSRALAMLDSKDLVTTLDALRDVESYINTITLGDLMEGQPSKPPEVKYNVALAIDTIRDVAPEYFKKNAFAVMDACLDNEEWGQRVVIEGRRDMLTSGDIAHDVRGLNSKDEDFLPRL